MNRREALKYTTITLGAALSATTTAAILQGCTAEPGSDWIPGTLSPTQAEALAAMAETILPATDDSPGARDVHVHRFIDTLLTDWANDETRQEWMEGFQALHQELTGKTKDPAFNKLSAEDQEAALRAINERALSGAPNTATDSFFLELKGQVIGGYFSSKEVGMNILAYDPVPGEYLGCIPVEEVGKAWSLR